MGYAHIKDALGEVIEIVIPGAPVGKAHTVRKGSRKIIPTKESQAWMNFVRALAKMAAPPEPWKGAIELTIVWYIVPTEGWDAHKKARALEGSLYPTVTPDCDNVSKSVCDALSKVIYADDRQIVDEHISKFYGPDARTVVTVRRLESIPTQPRLL